MKSAAPAPDTLDDAFADPIAPEARATAFNGLFLNFQNAWKAPFFLMLLPSVGIASMGCPKVRRPPRSVR